VTCTLHFGAGRTYTVTPEDHLWLLRAVEYEGAVQAQVAQTLVNCFCQRAARLRPGRLTLTQHVRAYAQPINPRWFLNGDLYKRWEGKTPEATPAHARRREHIHCKLNVFKAATRQAVDRALVVGCVDVPVNCTDYAAARIDASRKYKRLSEPRKGVNTLWSRQTDWTGYRVG
jgi:hypothetical protein